ncbi:MAG TPA: hypothetical protein VKM55_24315 [Candidatus Lokiarchaeia archaeon]|nr:hypothetical protein [Candidatus Lokiarchaeia archaeon]
MICFCDRNRYSNGYPNRETINTYVNCWFPDDYFAYFGFPGGTEYLYERWDSATYREQYTFIDCNINVSSQVVFFGKGSAVVSAMNVSVRGSPVSWSACQARMHLYSNFTTTNTIYGLPSKSINVTLVVPGNCYYGAGFSVFSNSSMVMALTSAWINKTITIPIPTSGNYSILFYATFDRAFYQTRRDLYFVVPTTAANPKRLLAMPPDISVPLAYSNNRTHSIVWTCIYANISGTPVVTWNGTVITPGVPWGYFNVTTTGYNYTSPENITLRFSHLAQGEYNATITVRGMDGSMMSDTVLVTVIPGNTNFTTLHGVSLYSAGYYASDILTQPIAISGLTITGPMAISVGTWSTPPLSPPLPANLSGAYIGIYAFNQQNIRFPFTITVPLPSGFNPNNETLWWFSWNSTKLSWTMNKTYTIIAGNAIIKIYHLSIYAVLIYDPVSFAKYDISTLAAVLNATSSSNWSRSYEKRVMLDEIGMVCKLFDEGYYTLAYNILLHDIEPKLTGLNISDNGTRWKNGTCISPWIVNPALRSMLRDKINATLNDIKACQELTIHDALCSLGNDLAALETLANGQLSSCMIETCDRLISKATNIYTAMLSRFQQKQAVNFTDIVKFQATITKIDSIAKNALISYECNVIYGSLGNITRAEAQGFSKGWFYSPRHHDLSAITGIHERIHIRHVNEQQDYLNVASTANVVRKGGETAFSG